MSSILEASTLCVYGTWVSFPSRMASTQSTAANWASAMAVFGLLAGGMFCWRKTLPWQNIFAAVAVSLGLGGLANWIESMVFHIAGPGGALVQWTHLAIWPAMALPARLLGRNICFWERRNAWFGVHVIVFAAGYASVPWFMGPFAPDKGPIVVLATAVVVNLLAQVVMTPWLIDKRLGDLQYHWYADLLLTAFAGSMALIQFGFERTTFVGIWLQFALISGSSAARVLTGGPKAQV